MSNSEEDFSSSLIADYLALDSEYRHKYRVIDLLKKYSIDSRSFYCLLNRNHIPKRYRYIDPLTIKLVSDDYVSGVSVDSIRTKYSLSSSQIYRIVNTSVVNFRNKPSDKYSVKAKINRYFKPKKVKYADLFLRINEVVSDYNLENQNGRVYTMQKLADKFDCTLSTLYSVLLKAKELHLPISFRSSRVVGEKRAKKNKNS